jgi:hypothetical protein
MATAQIARYPAVKRRSLSLRDRTGEASTGMTSVLLMVLPPVHLGFYRQSLKAAIRFDASTTRFSLQMFQTWNKAARRNMIA